MSYSELTIGDIFTITKGKKHEIVESQSIHSKRVIGIDDLRNDNLIRFTDDPKGTEVFDDDVLIAWDGANAGTIGYGKHGFIGSTIARLRFKEKGKFSAAYIGMLLKSKFDYLRQTATGATIPHISRKALERISVPNISLEDQSRTSYLLGKVESLIHERKQSLEQLDELLKSVFLDMFGDPVRNEKGWELRPCNKVVINIQSGTSYGGEEKLELESDELGVLKISAVTKGYLNPNEFKAVKKSVIKKPLRFLKKGDLLFSRANTSELVAACCIVDFDSDQLFLPDKLWALTLEDEINIQYMNHLLKNENFRNTVRKQASGGHDSMLNISMKKFLSLSVPVPKKEVQDAFSLVAEKIERTKSQYQSSLYDLEELYNALSQKAFKGDLDLSGIKLQDKEVELSSFDKLQHSIEAVDRLIPVPLKRTFDLVNKIVPPSVQQLSKQIEALPNKVPDSALQTLKFLSERPEMQIHPFSHLDLFGFNDSKARQQILEHWFNEWLEESQADELKLHSFWARAQRSLVDYLYEEDLEEYQFTVEDYDAVKNLLFQAIDNGLIKQIIDRVELDNKSEDGNRVVLVKG